MTPTLLHYCVFTNSIAAGVEVEGLKDFELEDLGEDAAIDSGEFLGEGEMEFLQKEAGDYAAVKKKLEGEIKSINAGVKKKKVPLVQPAQPESRCCCRCWPKRSTTPR